MPVDDEQIAGPGSPNIAEAYAGLYDQLADLKHLVYSVTGLHGDHDSVALAVSKHVCGMRGGGRNSVWLLGSDGGIEEAVRSGVPITGEYRRTVDLDQCDEVKRAVHHQRVVWAAPSERMREIFPEFDRPVLFPIKGTGTAFGFLTVNCPGDGEAEDFQLVAQFASIILEMSDVYRRLAQEVELRRSLEGLLRRERDTAQMYLDVAAVIMLALDEKGRVLMVNRMGGQVLGQPARDILGKNWLRHFVSPTDRELATSTLSRLISGPPGEVMHHEYSVLTEGGAERLIAWRSTATIDGQGRPRGSLSSGEDITERRQMEKDRENLRAHLVQAQKMEAIGTLSAGIAHDFNNLLTIVHGFAELLKGEFKDHEDGYDACYNIMQAARTGADLVQKLLAYSGKAGAAPRPLDLNKEVERILGLLSLTMPKTVRIDFMPAADAAMVVADPALIDQIVINLATNAGEAMPQGGSLTIDTANITLDETSCKRLPGCKPGPHARVVFSDTGHGMDKEKLERMFDPYFTSKEFDSTKGRGLGLTTVYGIVERLGGSVVCESAPGKGSVFRVYIPSAPEAEDGQGRASATLPADRAKMILWADNESLVGGLGRTILTRAGYDVLTAANTREVIDIYTREGPKIGLVVLDAAIPENGAGPCIEAVLATDPHARILVASGIIMEEDTRKFRESGAAGVLRKPYRVKETLHTVRNFLEREERGYGGKGSGESVGGLGEAINELGRTDDEAL